jgi:membrane protein YdbS with pleckstrin-like domain
MIEFIKGIYAKMVTIWPLQEVFAFEWVLLIAAALLIFIIIYGFIALSNGSLN